MYQHGIMTGPTVAYFRLLLYYNQSGRALLSIFQLEQDQIEREEKFEYLQPFQSTDRGRSPCKYFPTTDRKNARTQPTAQQPHANKTHTKSKRRTALNRCSFFSSFCPLPPPQVRVILYTVLSLVPFLLLLPFLGGRELMPLDPSQM